MNHFFQTVLERVGSEWPTSGTWLLLTIVAFIIVAGVCFLFKALLIAKKLAITRNGIFFEAKK